MQKGRWYRGRDKHFLLFSALPIRKTSEPRPDKANKSLLINLLRAKHVTLKESALILTLSINDLYVLRNRLQLPLLSINGLTSAAYFFLKQRKNIKCPKSELHQITSERILNTRITAKCDYPTVSVDPGLGAKFWDMMLVNIYLPPEAQKALHFRRP